MITRKDAELKYGKIVNFEWKNEVKHMANFVIPLSVQEHLINAATGTTARRIYCNKDMHAPLSKALQNLEDRNLLSELKTFDGCFNIRDVRGEPGALSAHAYGLALDLNAATNALGAQPSLSPQFVACFTDAGFTWGGNFKRKDGMHFSYCWE